ncbi:MAG: hypothetical protein LBQ81_01465 [Zoogloeaceae bacterium]|jgi:hypothetical protein|nr:hypothetical protein [Zoogloeaceae bacterium]
MSTKKCSLFVLSLLLLSLAGCGQDKSGGATNPEIATDAAANVEANKSAESGAQAASPPTVNPAQEITTERRNQNTPEIEAKMGQLQLKIQQKTQEMVELMGKPVQQNDVQAVKHRFQAAKRVTDEIYDLSEEQVKLQIELHENLLAMSEMTESRRRALQENLTLLPEGIQLFHELRSVSDAVFEESEKTSPDISKVETLKRKAESLQSRLQNIDVKIRTNMMKG